jgi:hypothetical protein
MCTFAFNVGLHSSQIKVFYIVQASWHWCDDPCGLVLDFYKNFRGLCLEFLNFRMEDPLLLCLKNIFKNLNPLVLGPCQTFLTDSFEFDGSNLHKSLHF